VFAVALWLFTTTLYIQKYFEPHRHIVKHQFHIDFSSFTSDERFDYEVSITGNAGNCWVSDDAVSEDEVADEYEEQERRDHTCTQCGGYSYSLDDGLCSNCKEDATCPECGGEKYRHDDLSSNCERKHEEEREEEERKRTDDE
jgi:hypothetical protein